MLEMCPIREHSDTLSSNTFRILFFTIPKSTVYPKHIRDQS